MKVEAMLESIFKNPTLIGYLVKRIEEEFPGKQIGKTVLQKMVYLLESNGICHFDYSMYHYGPYSSQVSGELNFAENNGIVEISWEEDKGYFIKPGEALDRLEDFLVDEEKERINEIVKKYGGFNAVELSLIATALFLKDNFNVSDNELAKAVHNIKTQYTLKSIADILQKSGIID